VAVARPGSHRGRHMDRQFLGACRHMAR
jgi:hypothetical protein